MAEGDRDDIYGTHLWGIPVAESGVIFKFLAPSYANEATVKMVKKLTPSEEEQLGQISSLASSDIPDRYMHTARQISEIRAATDGFILGCTVCSACGSPVSAIEEGALSRSLFGEVTHKGVTSGVFCHNKECSFYLRFIPISKIRELTNVAFATEMTVATQNFLREYPEFRRSDPTSVAQSPFTAGAQPGVPGGKQRDTQYPKHDESIEKWLTQRSDEELLRFRIVANMLIKNEQSKTQLLRWAFQRAIDQLNELSRLKHENSTSDPETGDDMGDIGSKIERRSSTQMNYIQQQRKSGLCLRCKKPFEGIIKESNEKTQMDVCLPDLLFISIHEYTAMCTDCIAELLLKIIQEPTPSSWDS